MEEMLKAIMVQWSSDAGAAAREIAKAGLWFTQAPEGVVDSKSCYGTYSIVGGSVMDTNTSSIETLRVQMSFFHEDDDKAGDLISLRKHVLACFQDQLLALDEDAYNHSRRHIQMALTNPGLMLKDWEGGWSLALEFKLMYGG